MKKRKHLVLALCDRGFGETLLGVNLAQKLFGAGDEVEFLARGCAATALGSTAFPRQVISNEALPLLRLYLDSIVADYKPSTIILADYATTLFAFEAAGLDFPHLLSYKRPIVAIDTWAMSESGFSIDLFQRSRRVMPDWSRNLNLIVTPVPIAMPRKGASYYSALPSHYKVSNKVRRHIRHNLGLGENDALVLFCTSHWQHARFRSRHGNQLARRLPLLVSHYIRRSGSRVHLVHVGPERYQVDLDGRYHWLPPLLPQEFDNLIGSVDVLLSANISATTLAKAVAIGVPAVNLVNSRRVSGPEDLSEYRTKLSREAFAWLKQSVPLYPFYLWPLGYFHFLRPVLAKNKYIETFSIVEALDEDEVVGALKRVIFDEAARGKLLGAQHEYAEMTHALPSPVSDIHRIAA